MGNGWGVKPLSKGSCWLTVKESKERGGGKEMKEKKKKKREMRGQ